jgi:hypothetical protein
MPRVLSPVLAAILNGHHISPFRDTTSSVLCLTNTDKYSITILATAAFGAQSIQTNRSDRGARDITRDDVRALVRQG